MNCGQCEVSIANFESEQLILDDPWAPLLGCFPLEALDVPLGPEKRAGTISVSENVKHLVPMMMKHIIDESCAFHAEMVLLKEIAKEKLKGLHIFRDVEGLSNILSIEVLCLLDKEDFLGLFV